MSCAIKSTHKLFFMFVIALKNVVAMADILLNSKVHYHIIPAPTFEATSKISVLPTGDQSRPLTHDEMIVREFHARDELESENAIRLQAVIASSF